MKYRYRTDEELKDSGIEWIGKIPKDWTISRIDKEFEVRNEKVSDKEYPPLSVTKNGILPQLENVAKSDNSDNRKKVCVGDFIINSRADRKGSCGVSSYKGSVSLICNVLTSKNLNSQYVHSLFRNYYFSEEFYRWGSGIVDDLWSTNIEKMKKINIPIPSKNEDVKIANFLDEKTSQFDSIISKKEELTKKLEEAKKSLISEVVTGKVKVVKTDDGYELVKRSSDEMKDSGVEWLGEIPKDWDITKLKYIGEAITGLTYSPNDMVDENEGTLILRSSNVQNGRIVLNDNVYVNMEIPQKLITREGDIIICSRNGSRSLIGKNACISSKDAGKSFGAFMTIFRSKYYEYLNFVFNSHIFKAQSGSFLTSTINQLTIGNLNNFIIALPNEKEEEVIVKYLCNKTSKYNSIIDKLKEQIGKLKEAKQSLISEAVTGKIEVLD